MNIFSFIVESPGALRSASIGLMGLATTAAAFLPVNGELAPYGLAGVTGITGFLAWALVQEKKERREERSRQERIDEKRIEADKARAEADKEAARATAQSTEVLRQFTGAVQDLIREFRDFQPSQHRARHGSSPGFGSDQG